MDRSLGERKPQTSKKGRVPSSSVAAAVQCPPQVRDFTNKECEIGPCDHKEQVDPYGILNKGNPRILRS